MPISQHNPRIYLASRSPRRRELLTQIGVQFDTIILRNHPREEIDEDEMPLAFEAPVDYVERMARSKAEQGWRIVGWRKLLSQPLLAADTTVEFEGQIIGKPTEEEDAKSILRRLSDKTHRVLTAVALAFEGRIETALSVSEVSFGVIDEAEIRRYVLSGEPMDKAGAYGIQGRAGLYVRHLAGSYTGVMGLPLHETGALLKRIGYPL
ncbi:nucleoside triphosphate pyrophosphatase [Propionivibrio sp.]|uniref:Maf family protein n=1 Tax=Propionivibrio sp. TaxID=2212460 RepID=UPI0025FB37FC|nr:nucleoside triphosphate pyrophosphatase [Propionivibrio sp.]MBK7355466.1 septum formation inhibitor Maf [Propionivibrio sp.]MBK8400868.1 septum formation inhibitor Maf [Propionivibrio sp.]MBK8744466.1 septum formation inhibitor Maf [Propionivibrio sp.]MBK8895030.1 septum formation inhibitor Maf [Propionivibrio sp.]MBL0209156.1 septum formation inhibitor Maf [Propionivibrio sp.]